MNFKSVMLSALAISISATIVGCGDDADSRAQQQQRFEQQQQALAASHQRELDCIQATGSKDCESVNSGNAVAQIPTSYEPQDVVQPGTYHNYYGNPQYGSWGPDNTYHFNDPHSYQASQTNAFLLGAVVGGVAGHLLTKNEFEKQNPRGWQDHTTVVNNYIDKSGRSINKDEYYRRRAQSYKDKLQNEQRKNAQLSAFSKPSEPQKPLIPAQPTLRDKIQSRNDFLANKPQPVTNSLSDKIQSRNDFLANKPQAPTQNTLQNSIQNRNAFLASKPQVQAPSYQPSFRDKVQARNIKLSSSRRK
jgi:hypothetical protein